MEIYAENGIIQLNAIGNISEDDCKKKLREAFSDVGERTPYEPETVFVEEAEDLTELTEELTMNQSKLVLGFRGGMTDENDDFLFAPHYDGRFRRRPVFETFL